MTATDQEVDVMIKRNRDVLDQRIAGTLTGSMTDLLNCCDVKLSANSKSVNIDVHVYEYATRERIDQVVTNAVYAFLRTQEEVKKEILKE